MTVVRSRKSLAALAVLACLTAVTGAAFVGIHFTQWDEFSLLLGAVLLVLVVICIKVLLDALENWVDPAGHDDTGDAP